MNLMPWFTQMQNTNASKMLGAGEEAGAVHSSRLQVGHQAQHTKERSVR